MIRRTPYITPKRLRPRSPPLYQMQNPWNIDPSCVLALRAEEGSTWKDYSGEGNDGTITAGTWRTGRRGPGLYFNGVASIVNCGADASLKATDARTIAFWFKLDTIASSMVFFCDDLHAGGDDVAVGFSTVSDQLFLGGGNIGTKGLLDVSAWITPGVWYHWVWADDMVTDTVTFYINGENIALVPTASFINPAGNVFTIGARTTGLFTKGIIDEFLMFHRLLTADEARALYELGKP